MNIYCMYAMVNYIKNMRRLSAPLAVEGENYIFHLASGATSVIYNTSCRYLLPCII